jgi:hypothetical protein
MTLPSLSRFGREVASEKWVILVPPCVGRTSASLGDMGNDQALDDDQV